MAERTPPSGYMTAKAAKRRLGNISDGKLRTLVLSGKIERIEPPDSTYGFYKASDVHQILQEWNKKALEDDEPMLPGAHFQATTKEDMPEIIKLIVKVWGGSDTSAKRNAWIDRNPESVFVVRSHGKVRGCIFILPLTEEKLWWLLRLDRNQTFGVIDIEDVIPFEVGKPANLFLLSMVSDDIGSGYVNRRKWGSVIVRGIFNHMEDLGRRGIPVHHVAARSDSKDGIRLLKHIGFTELEPKAGNKNFIIDVKLSGLDFAMKHKAAYAKYQESRSQP